MTLPQPASYEQKLKEWDSVPLFMRSLPGPDELTDDVAVNALQSLAYEGTPDEVAENFKSQGNEYFVGKRYREALQFYTQGMEAKPADSKLVVALLCNRAACNFELQNYGSVLRDCANAISLHADASKAYYRSAQALLALDRPDEAVDVCQRCLTFDPENAGVKIALEKALRASASKKAKAAKKAQEAARKNAERQRLLNAFKERGLYVDHSAKDTSDVAHTPHFENDTESAALALPAFFLYPQYAQSDTVAEFYEDTTFGDLLGSMFPPGAPAPDWDSTHQYVVGAIACYAITRKRRLLKVGMKMTLRELLNTAKVTKEGRPDGLELREGYLQFVVLPKGDVERGWVAQFKAAQAHDT